MLGYGESQHSQLGGGGSQEPPQTLQSSSPSILCWKNWELKATYFLVSIIYLMDSVMAQVFP